jgi:predicted transcriptional regulator
MEFTDLQKLCLKHKVGVEELHRKTGVPPSKLRAMLSGKTKIDDFRRVQFMRIFEDIDG